MSAKNDRQAPKSDSNRQRLRAEREAAAKRARVAKIVRFSLIGVVVIAVAGAITWAVMAATAPKSMSFNTEYTALIGQESAPVTVDIFQDYMCSACGTFERANAADIQSLLDSGQLKLRIHPLAFFDTAPYDFSSGTKYSTRSANAFMTVYRAEPDKAFAFNRLLYANQPKEGTVGLSDDEIAQFASQAGVSAATIATFANGTQDGFVKQTSDAASADGISSTPTIFINGTKFAGSLSAGPFKQAVLAAAGTKS